MTQARNFQKLKLELFYGMESTPSVSDSLTLIDVELSV